MIAIENIKQFRLRDIIAIISLAFLWLITTFLISNFAGLQSSFILSILILTTLMSFTAYLIKKAGSVILFCLIGAFLTFNNSNIGPTGWDKVITLLIAGIVFELVFLILKIEFKSLQLDIIFGTALSAASIPITTSLLISTTATLTMLTSVINLVILSFLLGVAGSIISFLLWFKLRPKKFILRFQYMM